MPVARALLGRGARERLADVAAHHELAAHDAHRLAEGGAHDRLAEARDEAAQERRRVADLELGFAHQLAGQHQPPGRGIDEQRIGLAEVVRPLSDRDLVGDQLVRRVGVRNAQQRLGEAHQHHALLRGEAVLLQEGLDAGLALAAAAGRDHERDGVAADRLAVGVGQAREREQLRDDGLLVREVACG